MQSSTMTIQNHGGPYLPWLMQKLLHMLLSEQTEFSVRGCISHLMQGLRIFWSFFFHLDEMFLRMALQKSQHQVYSALQ